MGLIPYKKKEKSSCCTGKLKNTSEVTYSESGDISELMLKLLWFRDHIAPFKLQSISTQHSETLLYSVTKSEILNYMWWQENSQARKTGNLHWILKESLHQSHSKFFTPTLLTYTSAETHRQIEAISGWMTGPRQELLPAFVTPLINHCTHLGNDPLRKREVKLTSKVQPF